MHAQPGAGTFAFGHLEMLLTKLGEGKGTEGGGWAYPDSDVIIHHADTAWLG